VLLLGTASTSRSPHTRHPRSKIHNCPCGIRQHNLCAVLSVKHDHYEYYSLHVVKECIPKNFLLLATLFQRPSSTAWHCCLPDCGRIADGNLIPSQSLAVVYTHSSSWSVLFLRFNSSFLSVSPPTLLPLCTRLIEMPLILTSLAIYVGAYVHSNMTACMSF